jgi:hypothetical protein
VLRTAQALTPSLTAREATISLLVACAVYSFIFAFGIHYIYRLLRTRPAGRLFQPPDRRAVPNRPMSIIAQPLALVRENEHDHVLGGSARHQHRPLCGARRFDLGVGILFSMARDDERRATMLSAVSPVWDGNEPWLVVTGVVLWGAFPPVYAALFSAY